MDQVGVESAIVSVAAINHIVFRYGDDATSILDQFRKVRPARIVFSMSNRSYIPSNSEPEARTRATHATLPARSVLECRIPD